MKDKTRTAANNGNGIVLRKIKSEVSTEADNSNYIWGKKLEIQ